MLRRRLIPFTAFALALALPAPAAAIVGGDPANDGDFPAQAFVGVDTDDNGEINAFCSGTLIGSRQVLTAARCTTNLLAQPRPASSFTVRVGQTALPDPAVVENVAGIDIPETSEIPGGYSRTTGRNDIAILTLEDPVDAEPVRVVDAQETAAWAPGTAARVLGWGETSQGGNISEVAADRRRHHPRRRGLSTAELRRHRDAVCRGHAPGGRREPVRKRLRQPAARPRRRAVCARRRVLRRRLRDHRRRRACSPASAPIRSTRGSTTAPRRPTSTSATSLASPSP